VPIRSMIRGFGNTLIANEATWSAVDASIGKMWRRLSVERSRLIRARIVDEDRAVVAMTPDLVVKHGPFAGLRYPSVRALGSSMFPKFLGSYERELHAWIEAACAEPYATIVNVGCAEGYYAVGLARRLRQAVVYAFDTNPDAQRFCRQMAELNQVADRVRVGATCDASTLVSLPLGPRCLVLSDCEGFERQLFTPETVERLAKHDFLIEAHDFIDPYVTPSLRAAFASTHAVTIISSLDDFAKLDVYDYEELRSFDRAQRRVLLGEYRPPMTWWFATPR